MATPFLSSEEYDERAHREYDAADYDGALTTLKEGLALYPHSVELYVGLGYVRVAREEYAWARQAFDRALVLDPEHEDALVGLGETLLRFGHHEEALRLFHRARESTGGDDLELMLSMGRALYREGLLEEARRTLLEGSAAHPNNADLAAALGYTLHRMDDDEGALRHLRRALHIDADHHESRIFMGHILYDRGEWTGALREFEKVPPAEHWDALAVTRLIELKCAVAGVAVGAPELVCWESRLLELQVEADDLDQLLAEIEAEAGAAAEADAPERARRTDDAPGAPVRVEVRQTHCVHLPDGHVLSGSWQDIVVQLRDALGEGTETLAQFMRRRADEVRARTGYYVPADDPQEFVVAGARAGCWHIEY